MLENTPTPMLAPLHQFEAAPNSPSRIAIKANGRILLLDPAEVIKLVPDGFVRVHRSALIDAAFVVEIQPWTTGEYVVRIKGGEVRSSMFPAHTEKTSIPPLRSGSGRTVSQEADNSASFEDSRMLTKEVTV